MIGQTIINYKILSQIGEGGMGEVYLAKDIFLDKKVALKFLKPEFVKNPTFVEMFKNEARLQSKLRHPNIIEILSFHSFNDQYFFVMEYFEGIPLNKIIQTVGPIIESKVIKIFYQVLYALDYSHQNNLIHRDIKPSNIIINNENNLKITDFGIAKLLGGGSDTKTGMFKGSIYYISPEQILGDKNIDHRTDLFSLGISLFEMLTGKIPYNVEDTEYQIMNSIVKAPLPSPQSYYPHISGSLSNVIYKLTNKNPEDRYSSARECIIELDSIFNDKNSLHANLNKTNTNQYSTQKTKIGNNYEKQDSSINSGNKISVNKNILVYLVLSFVINLAGFSIYSCNISVGENQKFIVYTVNDLLNIEDYKITVFFYLTLLLLQFFTAFFSILNSKYLARLLYSQLAYFLCLIIFSVNSSYLYTGYNSIIQSIVLIVVIVFLKSNKNNIK